MVVEIVLASSSHYQLAEQSRCTRDAPKISRSRDGNQHDQEDIHEQKESFGGGSGGSL